MRIALVVFFTLILFIDNSLFASNGPAADSNNFNDTISINKFFRHETTVDEIEPDTTRTEIPWIKYSTAAPSAMAIFISRPACPWLALAHGLKTIGVPFFITDSFDIALQHKVVMVYPELNASTITTNEFFLLRDFVREGGVLIGVHVEGLGLQDVFGYECQDYADDVNFVNFKKTNFKFDVLHYEKDKTIVVRNPQSKEKTRGTLKYNETVKNPIAVYNDGYAAIIENTFGKGKAYAFGLDIGGLLSLGYNGNQTDLARSYVNEYEPTLDILLRLVRDFYREAGGATLGTCANGKNLTVIFTHDLDYRFSMDNAVEYARVENAFKISATYFMQTKYVKDWGDEAFFTAASVNILKVIKGMNMEIGSHSVSHSGSFRTFDPGDGEERYPNYHPFIEKRFVTHGGSVSGEVLVSKHLLDSTVNANVVSFRPGHLAFPKTLPQTLSIGGYKFSSSITANDALTHFPYQQNYNREDNLETSIFEFPVTIEDEAGVMGDRIKEAIELADQISKEQGLMLILIHPNILGHKLAFEKKFLKSQMGKAQFNSLEQFGNWWTLRNDVRLEVRDNKIILDSKKPIEGLTILLPNGKSRVIPYLLGHIEFQY